MRIRSDFRQSYDTFLDPFADGEMPRMMRMGPSRRRQFEMLGQAGYATVEWGTVGQFAERDSDIRQCVIYDDENAHCGEGKRLSNAQMLYSNPDMGMPGGDRFYFERQKLASKFYDHNFTIRTLRVGWHTFTVRYARGKDWRSNVEPAQIRTLDCKYEGNWKTHWLFRWPIWSVDQIACEDGVLRACDLNFSPGLPDDLPLSPEEIGSHISSVWTSLGKDPAVPV